MPNFTIKPIPILVFILLGLLGPRIIYADDLTEKLSIIQNSSDHLPLRLKGNNWKSRLDYQIIKQDKDFSCGAAALATIFDYYYGKFLSENDVLIAMNKPDQAASFDDLQRAAAKFGFKAQGFATNYENLAKIKIPVILYLKTRKESHFSVLRGINNHTVWLADPSQGNLTLSKWQFMDMWGTRSSDSDPPQLMGKFLAILPADENETASTHFFTNTPVRQSEISVVNLSNPMIAPINPGINHLLPK